ncbi:MAG: cytosine permease [Bifidobacteriaceae bacterium]|jgi:purine-cytosine permease-like protein|nr:cytosine permease [Bifidobacteriaceae bacterium]
MAELEDRAGSLGGGGQSGGDNAENTGRNSARTGAGARTSAENANANRSEGGLKVEMAGTDVIGEAERKGKPSSLFWPWFAANISVLGISYGAWVLDFGISFGQAAVAGLVGIVLSFFLCGVVALAGKRGGAPTMVLARAALGVIGNRLAAVLSWILTVGWETVLTALAVMATATIMEKLGAGSGPGIKLVALAAVAVLIVGGGVIGFDLIMKMQTVITVVTGGLTIGYFILTFKSIDLQAVAAMPSGSAQAFVGALVFMVTGFGLGWVNMAADYSRYLPRRASSAGVIWWTTFGAAIAPLMLLGFGLLLAGSDARLRAGISRDPIGELTTILPTWYLVPFGLVAILGLVGGAVLDIYSSGLALISAGIPIPRPVAAGIDGVIMILGTVYIVFGQSAFFDIFKQFLITLGVPIAAWAGIMLADVLLRRQPYAEPDLFDPKGRYGAAPPTPMAIMVLGTAVGWGFVVNGFNEAWFLDWLGYLMGAVGGRDGAWAAANLGVLLALAIGFLGTLLLTRRRVQAQEALAPLPPSPEAPL